MNKNRLLGFVGLLGFAFVGGAVMPSLVRLGTSMVHPFLFTWLRVFLSVVIIYFLFKKKYHLELAFDKKRRKFGIVIGAGMGLNMILYSLAIRQTTLIASQLIYTLTPVVTSLLAYFLIKEKITPRKIGGMILTLAGVLILLIFSQSPDEISSLGTFYGNFLIFIGVFGYSTYLVFSRKLSNIFSIVEMVFLTNAFVSIFLLPLALYGLYQQGWAQINFNSLMITLLVTIGTLAFMALNQMAVKHLSAGTASLGGLLSPEFAALTGIIIYNEKLSLLLITSMILSIGGTLMATMADKTTFLDKIKVVISKFRK